MSAPCGSISGSPSVIHSATVFAMPGASLIQMAAADHSPFTSGVSPSSGIPSAVSDSRPLIAWRMPTRLVAQDVGHQLERLLELRVEVLLGERQLGRRQRRLLDRGDVVGVHQDRPVRVRADLHVAAVLALVHVRVHVAHDRERDLAGRLGQDRHRPDADHLVHRGRQRDRGAGHAPRCAGSTRRRRSRRSRSRRRPWSSAPAGRARPRCRCPGSRCSPTRSARPAPGRARA